MEKRYRIPDKASIGHVHLKVSDLKRSLEFYCDLLDFFLVTGYGDQAAFIAAGDYHHHIGLNVWYSKDGQPPPKNSTGLFHTAIRYPDRKDLATILHRLRTENYPLTGAADHGVSEALYLDDPDQNGVELYWDRSKSEWPGDDMGKVQIIHGR
jgi:catechol 2,3-dioxygenase